jgi:MFS family permease
MSGLESVKIAGQQSETQINGQQSAAWEPWFFDLLPAMFMDFSLYVSFFAIQQILKTNGVGPDLLGTTFAAYSAGYIFFCPMISGFIGRFRGPCLLSGLLIGMLCFAGMTQASELWHFQALLALMSLSTASFWPSFQNFIGDDCEPEDLPRRLAFFNLGWTVGKASGLVCAGVLTVQLSGHLGDIFWIAFALTSGCFGIFFLRFLRNGFLLKTESPEDAADGSKNRGVMAQRSLPYFLAALVVNFMTWGGAAAVIAQMPEIGERLNFAPEIQGFLLAAMVLSQFGSFFLLKRWRGWIFNWVYIAIPGFLAGLALFLLAYGTYLPIALLALGLFGTAIGFTYCASIYYALCPDGSSLRTGIHEAFLGVGSLSLPMIFGFALDRYPNGMFVSTSIMAGIFVTMTLLSLGVLFTARKQQG